jgi:hypothetical protein
MEADSGGFHAKECAGYVKLSTLGSPARKVLSLGRTNYPLDTFLTLYSAASGAVEMRLSRHQRCLGLALAALVANAATVAWLSPSR